MPRRPLLVTLSVGLALLLAACAAPPTQLGALLVTIAGLPAGVDADVTVTGPDGFDQDLTATETLTDLAAGSYTVAAQSLATTATTEYQPEQASIDVTVTAGQTAAATLLYAATPGALRITVSGLPSAADADLTVTGPDGFSQDLAGTTLLDGLTPGTYAIAANQDVIRSPGALVDALFELRSIDASVEVDSGATADASVTWNPLDGSGKLWAVAVSDVALRGYGPALLEAGGAPNPDVTVNVTGGGSDEFAAIDGGGNIWVTNFTSDTVSRFDVLQLGSDAKVTPSVVISSDGASLSTPSGLAFDADGNLWVTNTGSKNIERFPADQLDATGSPPPDVVIAGDGASLSSPCGLAFDASGNLWLTNENGFGSLERFSPAQLVAGGNPTPEVTIGSDGASLQGVCGLAFDADGNLWVASNNGDAVEMFTPVQLAASGAPTPAVTLTGLGAALDGPGGLAFDAGGGLWVSNTGSDLLERYAPSQLTSSGAEAPDSSLTVADLGNGIVFSPAPDELPLQTPDVPGPEPT